MKTAKFKFQSKDTKANVFGTVTLKDDGKVSISIPNQTMYRYSDRYQAKEFAKQIVASNFKHDGIIGDVKESNKVLIEVLRKETQSLRIQFIEETKKYAKSSFATMQEQLNMTMDSWFKLFDVKYKIVPPMYGEKKSSIQPEDSEYHKKNLYKMRDKMDSIKTIVGQGFHKYEATEVKWADIHYEDSLLKLSDRIAVKGLDESKREFHSPTKIGLALGYEYDKASPSVAVPLKQLVSEGKVSKNKYKHYKAIKN